MKQMGTGSWYCLGMVRALFCVCDGRGIDSGEEGPGELERNRNQTHGKSYCGGHHSDKIWCLLVSAEGVCFLPYLGR